MQLQPFTANMTMSAGGYEICWTYLESTVLKKTNGEV